MLVGLWFIQGGRVYTVASGSMQPTIAIGDIVVVVPLKSGDVIRMGDIVSYRDKQVPGLILTHRVIAIDSPHGRLITKGDNTTHADIPIRRAQLVGRVGWTLPWLGHLIDWLRRPPGLIVGIYIPLTIVAIRTVR